VKKSLSLSLFFAIALAAASDLSATSIVVNGGFETGDFTGWTVSTTSDLPWAIDTSVSGSGSGHGPNSGTYFASTGCVGAPCIGSDTLSTTAFLYQDLTTVAGDTYDVDFFFASGGEPGQELLVTFGGATVFDLVDLPGGSTTGYTEYSADLVATGTTTRLEFQGRQDPAYNALDDISVTDLSAGSAPEPSSVVMGLTAASSLFLLSGIRFGWRAAYTSLTAGKFTIGTSPE
jgi:hypothetical protein